MNKVIDKEMEDRHVCLCFKCGAVFEGISRTADCSESTCPDCESFFDTRYLTVARTWLAGAKICLK